MRPMSTAKQSHIEQRLEELRTILRAECMSYGELAELQGLAERIDPSDVELLEAAGVPEFGEDRVLMPYVITTYREGGWPHTTAMRDVQSRVAVATLEEAQSVVHTDLGNIGDPDWHDIANDAVSESGGTIGPLPDGTIIEVMAVCWNWIIGVADDRGLDTDALYDDGGDMAILAAFNAS